MQYILNAKERNQAFMQFFALFLLTVTVIVAAVYFNFRVPVKENRLLMDQINVQEMANQQQQKFITKMNEATAYADSLGKEGANVFMVKTALTGKMTELSRLQENDNPLYAKMNAAAISNLLELAQKKEKITELKAKMENADEYKRQNDERFRLLMESQSAQRPDIR